MMQLFTSGILNLEKDLERAAFRAALVRQQLSDRRQLAVRQTFEKLRSPAALVASGACGFFLAGIGGGGRRLADIEERLDALQQLLVEQSADVEEIAAAERRAANAQGPNFQSLFANAARILTLISVIASSTSHDDDADTDASHNAPASGSVDLDA
jgi:hypothetical protein